MAYTKSPTAGRGGASAEGLRSWLVLFRARELTVSPLGGVQQRVFRMLLPRVWTEKARRRMVAAGYA